MDTKKRARPLPSSIPRAHARNESRRNSPRARLTRSYPNTRLKSVCVGTFFPPKKIEKHKRSLFTVSRRRRRHSSTHTIYPLDTDQVPSLFSPRIGCLPLNRGLTSSIDQLGIAEGEKKKIERP